MTDAARFVFLVAFLAAFLILVRTGIYFDVAHAIGEWVAARTMPD